MCKIAKINNRKRDKWAETVIVSRNYDKKI